MANLNATHRLMAFSLTGLIAAGILGGSGIALAHSADDSVSAASDAASPSSGKALGQLFHISLKEAAAASGLTEAQLKTAHDAGKSLAQAITDAGGNPAAVQAKLLDDLKAKLAEAVTNGTITQAQADKAFEKAQEQLPKLFERHLPRLVTKAPKGDHAQPHIALASLDAAAKAIGITPAQLKEELKGGKSIADVAIAHGTTAQAVTDALVADANARIDAALAKGTIDAAKAAELKSKVTAEVTAFVSATHSAHGKDSKETAASSAGSDAQDSDAGINHAPSAAQRGKDHSSPKAALGAGNAAGHGNSASHRSH
jgi:hypothetical protein